MPQTDAPQTVTVTAPARLHLGFLDMNFGLGRRFGSLGLTLDAPATRLVVRPAGEWRVTGPDAARIEVTARALATALDLPGAAEIIVESAIPPHSGLGSGTQGALAIGAALGALAGRMVEPRRIAAATGRAARSGIGVAAFEAGGLIVDGGHGPDSAAPPPVIARLDVPEQWRVLLMFDEAIAGVHGQAERAAFGEMPPMSEADVGRICRRVLMQALPAVAEGDIASFGAAVNAIQQIVGDAFAPWQGGTRYTSPAVAAALGLAPALGAAGCGQSSWGPTGFALFADDASAQAALAALGPPLRCLIAVPRNTGAQIALD